MLQHCAECGLTCLMCIAAGLPPGLLAYQRVSIAEVNLFVPPKCFQDLLFCLHQGGGADRWFKFKFAMGGCTAVSVRVLY